jgi:hypothetical protein
MKTIVRRIGQYAVDLEFDGLESSRWIGEAYPARWPRVRFRRSGQREPDFPLAMVIACEVQMRFSDIPVPRNLWHAGVAPIGRVRIRLRLAQDDRWVWTASVHPQP